MVHREIAAKPTIYFVKRNYGTGRGACLSIEDRIEKRLAGKYNILSCFDFGKSTVEMVKRDVEKGLDVHAMITHMPWDETESKSQADESLRHFYSRLYKRSIELLWEIKNSNPLMPIMAYTGADHGRTDIDNAIKYVFQRLGPINEIVFKSGAERWEADAQELEKILLDPPKWFAPLAMPWGESIR